MKNKALIALIIFLSFSLMGQANDKTRIKSYDIKMRLDTVLKKIEIETVLEINNEIKDTRLLFSSILAIDSAKMDGKKLSFTHKGDSLILNINSLKKCLLTFWYCLPVDSFKNGKAIVLTRGMKWCPYLHDNISELKSEVEVPAVC